MADTEDQKQPRLTLAWIRAAEAKMEERKLSRAELARLADVKPYDVTRTLDVRNVGRKTDVIIRMSEALGIPLPDDTVDADWTQLGTDMKDVDPDLFTELKIILSAIVRATRELRAAKSSLAELLERQSTRRP